MVNLFSIITESYVDTRFTYLVVLISIGVGFGVYLLLQRNKKPKYETERCMRVRCLDAFDEFKSTNYVNIGSFYIVHEEKVLDIPLPSFSSAIDLLMAIEHDGMIVQWDKLLILEAGNELGQRDRLDRILFTF